MEKRRKSLIFWKLVERENAVRSMMISLLSFVATVGVVRTFLAITGYPQIGSGTLHIAHVLWGGLILYIAAILPLIYLNPRLHSLGAVLSGVGMGLFLDEVGKFITRQYDYFFPAAAPIMYVFFLLIVILAVMIRRPEKVDGRAELVKALEIVREQLYRPLDAAERTHVELDMNTVLATDKDALHETMARRVLEILEADPRTTPDTQPAWWRHAIDQAEAWLTVTRLSWLLGIGMVILGLFTLKNPFQVWLELVSPNSSLLAFLNAHAGRQISAADAPGLYNLRIILEVLVGVLFLAAAIFLAIGKRRIAINLGYLSALISLAVLDLLLFYFEQFSTVVIVLLQFIVLFGLIYYRRKFLNTKL
jgi:hypothetical protein